MISRTVARAPSFGPGREQSGPHSPALPAPGQGSAGSWTRPATPLLRFLLVLLFAFGLMCIYLWQLSTVTSMTYQIDEMTSAAAVIEHANAQLAAQVAAQNSPRAIDESAIELGMGPVVTPQFVAPSHTDASTGSNADSSLEEPALP